MKHSDLDVYFRENRENLGPESIYRAKTWARFDESYQLDFVDIGLMPLVEEEIGRRLAELIERSVVDTKMRLGWRDVSDIDGQWLLKATFWLLAAKILKDKGVPTFSELDLQNVGMVFSRLASHYGAHAPVPVGSQDRLGALQGTASDIACFANLGLVSTESLAFLYENALITRETRAQLGTHSTPGYLVDYMMGRLRPWIEEMHPQQRSVYEPACGHAAFLLAALRVLTELLPPDYSTPAQRHAYLRARLHGYEIDSFALEIARLRLTLADVPNPNGWDLREGDVFQGDTLRHNAENAQIIVANPPFEDFSSTERNLYTGLRYKNKAAEVFSRSVEAMQPGSIFGFILPQNWILNRSFAATRKMLLDEFELAEITLLPDKVFSFSDSESVLVLGKKHERGNHNFVVNYRRVREPDVDRFKHSFGVRSEILIKQRVFSEKDDCTLFIPELSEIWGYTQLYPRFQEIASIDQGFSFESLDSPQYPKGAVRESSSHIDGFVPGVVRLHERLYTHEHPEEIWVNLHPSVISRPRGGTVVGTAQVLLNYAPVSRDAWRLKAFVDLTGHAASSRFLIIRPLGGWLPIEVVWALCNSPIANAYAYAFASKRDHTAGLFRQMPVPDMMGANLDRIVTAVRLYLQAADRAGSGMGSNELKLLHWTVDAEVLRLYALPVELEWKLLELFSGVTRRGVPFQQNRYVPEGAAASITLKDLIEVTERWDENNQRRGELILKRSSATLSEQESNELAELQYWADARLRLLAPFPFEKLEAIHRDLVRSNLADGSS